VATNSSIFNGLEGGVLPLLPPLKAVKLAVRAASPRAAHNTDVISLVSVFADAAAGGGRRLLVASVAHPAA